MTLTILNLMMSGLLKEGQNEECIEKEDDNLNENIVTSPIDVDLNAVEYRN